MLSLQNVSYCNNTENHIHIPISHGIYLHIDEIKGLMWIISVDLCAVTSVYRNRSSCISNRRILARQFTQIHYGCEIN